MAGERPRLGSLIYNLFHNWVIGLALLGLGAWLSSDALVIAGTVLIGQVATHLQRA